MVQFQIAALAYISDLGIEGITQANLAILRDHSYEGALRVLGLESTWNFRRGGIYAMPFLSNTDSGSPVFYTTADAFDVYKSFFTLSDISSASGDSLKFHNSDTDMVGSDSSNDADGYWAPVICNLNCAVEHGKAGAEAALARIEAASNYDPVGHAIADKPKWSTRKRSTPSVPAWLSGASVSQWISLQAPSAAGVGPSPTAPGNGGAVDGSGVQSYSGGALRLAGNWLLQHGGGHSDYAGNEIYGLSLDADSPAWQRIWGPTPNAQIVASQNEYNDGNPAACHTYGRMHYDQQRDRLMRFARGQYTVGSTTSSKTYGWNWLATNWTSANTYPAAPGVDSAYTDFGDMTWASDYLTGDVFGFIGGLYRLKWHGYSSNWESYTTASNDVGSNSACYDSRRGVVWASSSNVGFGKLVKWNVHTDNSESVVTLTGASASSAAHGEDSPMVYDPVIDKIFAYNSISRTLHQIDPETSVATTVSTTGTAPAATSDSGNAIYTRMQYVPRWGGIVIQGLWSDNCKFIRTH
jgi:hypothetical protein